MVRLIQTSDVPLEGTTISDDAALGRPIAPDTIDLENLNEGLLEEADEPTTVREAIDTYLKFNKSKMNEDDHMARAEYARYNQYPRICESDRKFQEEYDLTTATLTRRLSPLDESGEMLTPWELSEQLHGGGVQGAIRSALDYHLSEFNFEWVGVTTPREDDGTPQEHIHLWIDDPSNQVTPRFLESAREKHIEYVPNAYSDDHRYQADGTAGCIRVSTDPNTVDELPEETASIITHSDYPARHPTQSAHYVATQLPDLIVFNYYNEDHPTPPLTLQEGAAAGWAVPHRWFRTSTGIAPVEDFPGG